MGDLNLKALLKILQPQVLVPLLNSEIDHTGVQLDSAAPNVLLCECLCALNSRCALAWDGFAMYSIHACSGTLFLLHTPKTTNEMCAHLGTIYLPSWPLTVLRQALWHC